MKIRNGFVSNSSSSSFVVIDRSGNFEIPDWSGDILVSDNNLGETEFGWDVDEFYDIGSKINFAYLQAKYGEEPHDYGGDAHPEWLKMLEKVIMENTGVLGIDWRIVDEYNPEGNKIWGYIDHQSSAVEGENTEIFDDEEALKQFLFGKHSYIETGNDND